MTQLESKIIKYNKAVFMTGGIFTKLWMATLPVLSLSIIINTVAKPEGWSMALFALLVLLLYPVRNYFMVKGYLEGDHAPDRKYMVEKFKTYLDEQE